MKNDDLSRQIRNRLRMTNEIDLKRLGHAVRFRRQGKEWGLAELAARSGVSKGYISDLENGVAGKPNIQYVYSIARALDVTLDELLNHATDDPQIAPTVAPAHDLPPGLAELQQEMSLSDRDLKMLASVNFRGHRPRDKEGWRYLLETLRMLSRRNITRQK
jgi:transcriptional regulator with XRE-family HTH domain